MLMNSLDRLYALGAINDLSQLTKLGRRLAEFPLSPSLSKTILESASLKYKCLDQILSICAMLS
jgi:pre-mRNA-splicing factor ATP-dependent RNA helicase DHX16